MAKDYSPGPWGQCAALSSDQYNIRYISDADGNMVASVRSGFTHFGPDQFDQNMALANARLIKHAPELLEALEELIPFIAAGADATTAYRNARRLVEAVQARKIL